MSSSRSIAAMASLPHTRFDGALGTGRSISLPAAAAVFSAMSIVTLPVFDPDVPRLGRIPPVRTRVVVATRAAKMRRQSLGEDSHGQADRRRRHRCGGRLHRSAYG